MTNTYPIMNEAVPDVSPTTCNSQAEHRKGVADADAVAGGKHMIDRDLADNRQHTSGRGTPTVRRGVLASTPMRPAATLCPCRSRMTYWVRTGVAHRTPGV